MTLSREAQVTREETATFATDFGPLSLHTITASTPNAACAVQWTDLPAAAPRDEKAKRCPRRGRVCGRRRRRRRTRRTRGGGRCGPALAKDRLSACRRSAMEPRLVDDRERAPLRPARGICESGDAQRRASRALHQRVHGSLRRAIAEGGRGGEKNIEGAAGARTVGKFRTEFVRTVLPRALVRAWLVADHALVFGVVHRTVGLCCDRPGPVMIERGLLESSRALDHHRNAQERVVRVVDPSGDVPQIVRRHPDARPRRAGRISIASKILHRTASARDGVRSSRPHSRKSSTSMSTTRCLKRRRWHHDRRDRRDDTVRRSRFFEVAGFACDGRIVQLGPAVHP